MKALIIDDSRAMRCILGKIMRSLGFEVLEAADGREGVSELEAHSASIDIILVDWNMPEMDGIEFVEHVRSCDEFAEHKIVMVTTETEPTRMARALLAGVDEFVMKPFTEEILVAKLLLIGVKLNQASVC